MKNKIGIIIFFVGSIMLALLGLSAHKHRPDILRHETKIQERTISFFQRDYAPLLEGIKEQALEDSKLILEVKSTGARRYIQGELIQEVSFVRAVKGKVKHTPDKGEIMYLMGNGWSESNGCVSTGFINYLKKGEHYIVFANGIYKGYHTKSRFIKANVDLPGMRCLNITTDKSYAYKCKGDQTKYKNVKDSEFFANDPDIIQKMKQCKHDILKTLNISPEWES